MKRAVSLTVLTGTTPALVTLPPAAHTARAPGSHLQREMDKPADSPQVIAAIAEAQVRGELWRASSGSRRFDANGQGAAGGAFPDWIHDETRNGDGDPATCP
ncbi:hypothetical protein Ssi02_01740 [Sinosporangium siamense]|uniref:Uncharacterized protein n=1 Tax=Sinosporangium siamense TaxID=1367973 RepID=A0A919V3X5_9ACTN|nr:hypothetical protein Ssi02_01740 [Sinosporangium siamense]